MPQQTKHLNLKAIAPAKINLCLHITGKTKEGYHLLDSLTVFSDFGDEVIISSAPNNQSHYTLNTQGKQNLLMDAHNLVVRAHKALEQFIAATLPCHIHLIKRLPIGAGIGGGSSDAATTLLLLNQYFSLNIPLQTLQKIALSLGADIPVCLHQKSCYMAGIGEIITPINHFPELHIGLIYPNKSVSTAAIFQDFHGDFTPPLNRKENFYDFSTLYAWLMKHHNDLEPFAINLAPEIGHILRNLRKFNSKHRFFCGMSGSGSTCFIISTERSVINDCFSLFLDSNYQLMQGKILKNEEI